MHRITRTLMSAALMLSSVVGLPGSSIPAFAAPDIRAGTPTDHIPGELLVGLRAGTSPQQAEALSRRFGFTVVEAIAAIRVVRVSLPEAALDAVAQALARSPEVRFVERNLVFDPVLVPNDPEYPKQWHLPRIRAPQAWDLVSVAAGGVVIAIVDSGVDPYHPDLASRLVAGYNTYDASTNTADVYGHGTEVAGAAAAATDNALGLAGVAGWSAIMPIRVTNGNGRATSANIASGVVWAADHGAGVVNLSFNGIAGNATVLSAAQYAVQRGSLVVAAAGNCGCLDATAETPFVLSVSATDENDSIAYFSSTGSYVDIAAPGTNILTTALGGTYLSDSGTSLASPIVAGVAALMLAAKPSLTPAVVTQLLEATAGDGGPTGYDTAYGYGRVDAFAAVSAAASYVPVADTQAPTVAITAPVAGATVSGTTVVSVAAADDVGVAQVDLFVDGAFTATDALSPYGFAWDSTTIGDGAHALVAVATDAAGNSASATITINVANSNAVPVAANDAYAAPYRTGNSYAAQVLDVLANDRDPDGSLDLASIRIVKAPSNGGTVSVNTNGTVSYTPKRRYRGSETFGYTVKDKLGATSNTAIVTVTIQ